MYTKIKIILALIVVSITVSSCDDYLDLRPQDGIVGEEFWKTKEDVRAAVIGIYSSMLNTPPGTGSDLPLSKYLFMYGELRGDMVSAGQNVTEDERDIMNTNILASNELTRWAAFYKTINYCNTVIELAPGVRDEDPTLTQTQLNNYLSEAYAVRAYLYFTLARTFRDVPLKLTPTLTDQEEFKLPKNYQAEIFEQVIKDLKQAEEFGVETYGDQASDNGRITKDAINAMLTDVYLWTENYQEALNSANKVINTGKYALIPAANNTWFNKLYAEGNSTESIFEFQYTPENRGPFYVMFLQRTEFIASPIVLEEVFGIDYNDANNKDIRGEWTSLVPGTNLIYKFIGLNNDTRKDLQDSDTHWFVYRYTDVLLMKAEALAELDQGAEALTIIEEIRTNRKAIDETAQVVDPTSKFDVIDYILAERAREFAYEGKRWYDVLRNARKNNYERLQILIDMAMVNAPPEQQQSIITKLKDPNSHYLPINTYELFTNKALVQNPFYK